MCSADRFEESYLAVAAMDLENPDLMIIEVFDTSQKKLENVSRPPSILETVTKSEKKVAANNAGNTTSDRKLVKEREKIDICSGRFRILLPTR